MPFKRSQANTLPDPIAKRYSAGLCLDMDSHIAKPVRRAVTETMESARSAGQRPKPEASSTYQQGPTPWRLLTILECLQGDETLLRELLQIFIDECPNRLAMLEKAIETGDGEQIEKLAHTLKGELAYLGESEATEGAGLLECAAQERSLQSSADLFCNLKGQLRTTTARIRDFLEHNPPGH
jgi:two-component system, sensor histidine kinase and response regulator